MNTHTLHLTSSILVFVALAFLCPHKPSESSRTIYCLSNVTFNFPNTGLHWTRPPSQWLGQAAVSRWAFSIPAPLLFNISPHSPSPWVSYLQIKTGPSVPLYHIHRAMHINFSFSECPLCPFVNLDYPSTFFEVIVPEFKCYFDL